MHCDHGWWSGRLDGDNSIMSQLPEFVIFLESIVGNNLVVLYLIKKIFDVTMLRVKLDLHQD